jgi:hypothetical protein
MAYLEKKIKGNSYFYEVQSYRDGGMIKQRVLRYFGRQDPRKYKDARPIIRKEINDDYRFGDAALIYKAATEIDLFSDYLSSLG